MSKTSSTNEIDLGKELGSIYLEICTVSQKMRDCDSSIIRQLHKEIDKNKYNPTFRYSVIAGAIQAILYEPDIKQYIKDIDKDINKAFNKTKFLNKFGRSKNIWDLVSKKYGVKKTREALIDFYNYHFLTALRFLLSSYIAKKRNVPAYMYMGSDKKLL